MHSYSLNQPRCYKGTTNLALTLSLGQRPHSNMAAEGCTVQCSLRCLRARTATAMLSQDPGSEKWKAHARE